MSLLIEARPIRVKTLMMQGNHFVPSSRLYLGRNHQEPQEPELLENGSNEEMIASCEVSIAESDLLLFRPQLRSCFHGPWYG